MKRILLIIMLFLLTACDGEGDIIDCKDNEEVGGVCLDTTPPIIAGADDISIVLNDSFDSYQGVTANDDLSGDVTATLTVNGIVNTGEYGTYLLTYNAVDEVGNIGIHIRYVTVVHDGNYNTPNLVTNGYFDNGFSGFTTYMADAGSGTFNVVDGVLEITVTKTTSSINWEPRLEYQNLTLIQGHTYFVSLDLRSEEARLIEVLVGELYPQDPWFVNYDPNRLTMVAVEPVWQTYSFTFTMNQSTTNNGSLLLHLGAVGMDNLLTTIYVDNIIIQDVE